MSASNTSTKDIPVDDIPDCTKTTKHHERNIDSKVLQLPPESNTIQNLVERIGELVAVSTWNEANNRCIPEVRTGKGGNEVNDTDKKDTFHWAREGG